MRMATAVAIVTGAASGIGRAIAERLAAGPARVVLADRQADVAEQVAAAIRAKGGEARAVELDVRDAAAFRSLVDATVADAGRIDLLFNVAGIAVAGEARDFDESDWDDVLDVNLRGVVHGILAAYPRMIEQGSGHIVNVASVSGLVPGLLQASYTTSKHAVVGLSRGLRLEAARHGVKVSVVCPGAVRTPILRGGRYGRVKSGLDLAALAARVERLGAIEPSRLAELVLRGIARNRAIIVEPRSARLVWRLDRLSPRLSERLWGLVLARALRGGEAARRRAPE